MKRKPFRPGDLVKIVDPRSVTRVGYPKTPTDYEPEVEAEAGRLLDALVGCPKRRTKLAEKVRRRCLRELCYLAAKRDSFGGPERAVHLADPVEELRGRVTRAVGTHRVNVGLYYPPCGGVDGDGNPDWEPGGLSDQRVRVLVEVSRPQGRGLSAKLVDGKEPAFSRYSGRLVFPAEAIRAVDPCKPCDARQPRDVAHRDDLIRTVHFITHDFVDGQEGYVARCYHCGTPFEEAAS